MNKYILLLLSTITFSGCQSQNSANTETDKPTTTQTAMNLPAVTAPEINRPLAENS
jgi:PBP1b-binding outer membrane lipoprotein LpoB